jgi:predicted Zn finger-like uncharacterized protein
MAVTVNCPGCRTSYPVTEDLLGKKIRCKKCQETFTATAAKSPAGSRAADERITSRRPVRDEADEYDDEDEAPRRNGNGRARPAAKRPPQKSNKGLLIGGIAGGVLLLAGGIGLGVWILNKDDTDNTTSPPVAATPPVSTGTQVVKAPAVDTPSPTTGGAASENNLRTAAAPESEGGLQIVPPKRRPASFKQALIDQAKKSTVLIRCTFEEGLADGSGWVAERHGNEAYIVTNSHVVGMKEPARPQPEKIQVIVNAGLGDMERTFEGKLLALDREEDLAVIRIKGHDLPSAFKIARSNDLQESQLLEIIGFPHGKFLEKELKQGLGVNVGTTVSSRRSSVSRRVLNHDGSVKYIQAEGGADPGNSGGPVVDTNGNVVAVLVAGKPGTTIRFVIPSEYVIQLLHGHVYKVMPGQAVSSGVGIRQPLTALVADPLRRLRSVEADIFVGKKPNGAKGEKSVRDAPPAGKEPQAQDGDGPRTTVALNYDAEHDVPLGDAFRAKAEASLPPVTDDQIYWFQPHYQSKDGTSRWAPAIALEMGRYPVEAKPAHLAYTPKPDMTPGPARRVELESKQLLSFEAEGGGAGGGEQGLSATLTEKTRSVEKNGDAKVRLQYIEVHPSDADESSMFSRAFRGIESMAKGLGVEVTVTKEGRFNNPTPDFANVPQAARPVLRTFNSQIINSLEGMALGLPGKDLQPGDTWDLDSQYTIFVVNGIQNALFKATCTYTGTRIRDGREEAVIEINGQIASTGSSNSGGGGGERSRGSIGGSPGESPGGDTGGSDNSPYDEDGKLKKGFFGVLRGAAVVDVTSGLVTLGRTELAMAVVFPIKLHNPRTNQDVEIKIHAGLGLETTLRRSLTKDPPKPANAYVLLPNQPRGYNTLVESASAGDDVGDASTESVIPQRNTAMPREATDRVKRAAVFVKVHTVDGSDSGRADLPRPEGSGFFAAPGLVLTTSDVVGMLSKTDRPPASIEIVLNAGTGAARAVPGELVAVDHENHIALVRVKGDNFPEPLKVGRSDTLVESQPLTVAGFPEGSDLSKGLAAGLQVAGTTTPVSLRSTMMSRQVPNAIDQTIKYIQLEGGVEVAGDSGGPVVDDKGEVRCVAVASAAGTGLRFGVPAEYITRMLDGYPLEVVPGRAYKDGSTAKQPVDVKFADPLNRVTAVHLDYWLGSDGKARKPSDKEPKPRPDDLKKGSVELTFKPGVRPGEKSAQGEFVLPEPAPGQVCYLQPRFVNGTGSEHWSRGVVYAPDGPPVERKATTLEVKYKAGAVRDVELTTLTRMHYVLLGQDNEIGSPFKVNLSETIGRTSRGTVPIQLEYKNLELDWKKILPQLEEYPQIESALNRAIKPYLELIRGVVSVVTVNRNGKMMQGLVNYARLPLVAQPQFYLFNNQIVSSLQALTFPLPGKDKQVPYGYTWDFPTDLFVAARGKAHGALFKMHFKYAGVRDRGGRQEAVVEISGSLASNPNAKIDSSPDAPAETPAADAEKSVGDFADTGSKKKESTPEESAGTKGLFGVAHGFALIDVQDGFVSHVKLYIDLDAEVKVRDPQTKAEVPVVAGGSMELQLRRRMVGSK